jgi:hypothetical protein
MSGTRCFGLWGTGGPEFRLAGDYTRHTRVLVQANPQKAGALDPDYLLFLMPRRPPAEEPEPATLQECPGSDGGPPLWFKLQDCSACADRHHLHYRGTSVPLIFGFICPWLGREVIVRDAGFEWSLHGKGDVRACAVMVPRNDRLTRRKRLRSRGGSRSAQR